MTSFSIFDDVIEIGFCSVNYMKSHDRISDVTNHFRRDNSGTNFKFMLYLEVEILG